MKLEKINKTHIIIAIILILNVSIITIPYTFKNNALRQKILKKQSDILIPTVKENKDFYKIYDDFNDILYKLDITSTSKTVSITDNMLSINIILETDINTLLNLLTYIDKDIEDMYISFLDVHEDKPFEITFNVEN